MHRTCVKCGHTNAQATGADTEACPSCGAIYSKAVAGRPSTPRTPASSATADKEFARSGFTRPEVADPVPMSDYVSHLRAGTVYPAFRTVTRVSFWLATAVCAVMLAVSLRAIYTGDGQSAGMGGVVASLVLWIVVRAFTEAAHMLADLSDATLRIAARGDRP